MCLTTKTPEIQVAKRDIVCYKDTGCFFKSLEMYQTDIMNHNYKIGERQPTVVIVPFEETIPNTEGIAVAITGNYIVEAGYHTHQDKHKYNTNYIFIIPKGTKYIKGWNNRERAILDYVSETVVFIGPDTSLIRFKLKLKALWKQIIGR